MPPQPLSKVRQHAKIDFEIFSFLERPSLAPPIAEIFRIGSVIDHIWSRVLVDLLRADPGRGMAMYQAVSSSEARLTALKAAAEVSLEKDDYILLECVLASTKAQRSTRNDFAHHIWGKSDDLPNALLLLNPKEAIATRVSIEEANRMMLETGVVRIPDRLDRSKIMVWTEKSLAEAVETAQDTLGVVRHVEAQTHFWGSLKVERMQSALSFLRLGEQVLQRGSKETKQPIPPAPRGRTDPL